MSTSDETATFPTSIWVEAWPDELASRLGHDPRSHYVELFWLGVLGPSTTWLIRRLAAELEASPGGFELRPEETAREMGVGGKAGRNSILGRSIERACQFGVARRDGEYQLYARPMIPPLSERNVERLPPRLRQLHDQWTSDGSDHEPTRARRLALTLFELGDQFDEVERQLHLWGVHPAAAYQGAMWAHGRHSDALAAAIHDG